MAQQMQNLVQGIIDSYEMRVKMVSALMKEAAEVLRDFCVEQEEVIAKLSDDFDRDGSLRKRDFDSMIKNFFTQQAHREQEVARVLEACCSGAEETAAKLKRILTDESKALCLEDLALLKRDILVRQKERERKAAEAVREFHREQEELNGTLRKLLLQRRISHSEGFGSVPASFSQK